MNVSSTSETRTLDVQGVLADVSIATGSVTIGLMLTGRFVFQYLGWGVAAAATPVVMAITGSAFFGMSLAAQYGTSLTFGPYSLAAAGVMAGAVTQVTLPPSFPLSWLTPSWANGAQGFSYHEQYALRALSTPTTIGWHQAIVPPQNQGTPSKVESCLSQVHMA